ncbi:hypothetical protein [Rhodocaloribacter sp.]
MKRALLALTFLTLTATAAHAQSRVYEKDLTGTWKLMIDLDGKDADSALERIAMKAVDGLLDEIDIRFVFMKDHRLKVVTRAFDDEEEDEDYSEWRINDRGELILGDSDKVDFEDTVWLRKGDRLLPFEVEDGKRKEKIYLVRIR